MVTLSSTMKFNFIFKNVLFANVGKKPEYLNPFLKIVLHYPKKQIILTFIVTLQLPDNR